MLRPSAARFSVRQASGTPPVTASVWLSALFRALLSACLLLAHMIAVPAQAEPGVPPAVRRWIAAVVTKVGEADGAPAAGRPRGRSGTVEIRLRIAADGSLRDATIERGSGSAERDAWVLAAARAAGPFGPPPRALLTADGTTELSFPLDLAGHR